ncbi:hypothetical protein K435DRAFT_841758 [Dendrothele bispora CBS 962.96]|uniref:Uncharacterized protein n=1 Tax=Dendrothele bispora (strain CBS 962.96) TaxID=1314807 RepID=A0A4S8LKM5_DENBC|nr:hypothetical protein K435DRAFT_841758 [Dendrothele bispora CBS 962.96]
MFGSSFFDQTSQCSFEGTINNVAGDQITQIFHSQDQITSNGARGESIFDEYHNFLRGDIKVLQDLSTREIDEEKEKEMSSRWDRNPTHKLLKYTATTYRVKLFGTHSTHNDDNHKCVAVRYGGSDAYAAWERDLSKYSKHHQNLVHLFGVSKQKSNPTLVFCDDVVPLVQIWETCPPIIQCYLQAHVRAAEKNIAESLGGYSFAYENLQIIDYALAGIPFSKEPDKLLPCYLLHDEARALEYLFGIPKKDSLSQEIISDFPLDRASLSGFPPGKNFECNITLPSIISRIADSFKTIGQFKNLDESYSYRKELLWMDGLDSTIVLTIGDRVFIVMFTFLHNYAESYSLHEQHMVTMAAQLEVGLDIGTVILHPNILPGNIFLFIAPVILNKCPENGSTEVSLGKHGENHYFWSFDPDGSTHISKEVCDIIGLPKYRASLLPLVAGYQDYHWKAIQRLQELCGYDPSTQDFARANGFPLLEISPSKEPGGLYGR